MSYRELYEYCQNLPTPISRRELIANVCRLTGKPRPRVIMSGLNPEIVRGYFIVPENTAHPFTKWVHAPGGAIIVVARGMNHCWKRFVEVKELMHLFDEPLDLVGEADIFQDLLTEFVELQPEWSDAFRADTRAVWLALGVLCPEAKRQEFARLRTAGEIENLAIAQQLRIPERYVPHLFNPAFRRFVDGAK